MTSTPSLHSQRLVAGLITGSLCLGLAGLGVAPAQGAGSEDVEWATISGTLLAEDGSPYRGTNKGGSLIVTILSVACGSDPDTARGIIVDGFWDTAYTWTDADSVFALKGSVGKCYLLEIADHPPHLTVQIDERVARKHIIGPLTAADLTISATVRHPQGLRITIPGSSYALVALFHEQPSGTWTAVDEESVGIQSFSEAGLLFPHDDERESVYFSTVPGETYALVHFGRSTYYPQVSGGARLDPATSKPYKTSDFVAGQFTAPLGEATFSIANPFRVGATITGRVALPSGGSVPQTSVTVRRYSESTRTWIVEGQPSLAEPDGTFTIPGITPSDTVTVVAQHPGYAETWLGDISDTIQLADGAFTSLTSPASGSSKDVGTITLGPAGAILVTLANSNMGGSRKAPIIRWTNVETGQGDEISTGELTNRISSLPAGVYALQERTEGYWQDWYEGLRAEVGAEAIIEVEVGKTTPVTLSLTERPSFTQEPAGAVITGKPKVGEVLSVEASDWAKKQWSKDPWTYSTTWVRNHKIVGTGNQRTLQDDDAGSTLHAAVLVTGDGLWPQWLTPRTDRKVEPEIPVVVPINAPKTSSAIVLPKIAKKGTILKAPLPTSGSTAKYQWYRNNKAIKGATKAQYKVKAVDVGKRITVKMWLSKPGQATQTIKSTVAKITGPKVKGVKVRLAIPAQAGAKLKAKVTAKTKKVKVAYQWYVGGKPVAGKVGKKPSYTPKKAALNKKVQVKVTVSKAGYLPVTKKSKPLKIT